MAKELKEEELEQVVGGSHVSSSDIGNYVGQNMKFSYGIFAGYGPYNVHIDSVSGTWVVMTFTDDLVNWPDFARFPSQNTPPTSSFTNLGKGTWEFNYAGDMWATWLE